MRLRFEVCLQELHALRPDESDLSVVVDSLCVAMYSSRWPKTERRLAVDIGGVTTLSERSNAESTHMRCLGVSC
jgi:hypothetical protein